PAQLSSRSWTRAPTTGSPARFVTRPVTAPPARIRTAPTSVVTPADVVNTVARAWVGALAAHIGAWVSSPLSDTVVGPAARLRTYHRPSSPEHSPCECRSSPR